MNGMLKSGVGRGPKRIMMLGLGVGAAVGLIQGTTCQFNSPRRLAVSSKGGAAYFDIPNALPATVTVSESRPPSCVLAAHYKGD